MTAKSTDVPDGRAERDSRPSGREVRVKHSITVTVGAIASKILAVEMVVRGHSSSTSAERAIRVYLEDKKSPGPGWTYPSFLRGRRPVDGVEVQLDLDLELWRELSQEAISQEVSAQQLLEHAVLYFAAEDNAGRVTERILEDLDED
jgi:hypothetical protein